MPHEREVLPSLVAKHHLGAVFVRFDATPREHDRVGRELRDLPVGHRAALVLLVAERGTSSGRADHVGCPGEAPGCDHRLGPPLHEDGRSPLGRVGRVERSTHLGHERLGSVRDAEQSSDLTDVAVDVFERHRLRRDESQPRRLQALHDPLVSGHGERGEHQFRLERGDLLDVDVEVRADLRQGLYDVFRMIGVVVHADQEIGAAERTHDLGIRAGEGDDTHDRKLPPLTRAVRIAM